MASIFFWFDEILISVEFPKITQTEVLVNPPILNLPRFNWYFTVKNHGHRECFHKVRKPKHFKILIFVKFAQPITRQEKWCDEQVDLPNFCNIILRNIFFLSFCTFSL